MWQKKSSHFFVAAPKSWPVCLQMNQPWDVTLFGEGAKKKRAQHVGTGNRNFDPQISGLSSSVSSARGAARLKPGAADFHFRAVDLSANQATSFGSPAKPLYWVLLTGTMVAPCHLCISEWPSQKANPQAPLW
jgi:hypothetical protein